MALRGEVVNLVRLHLGEDVDQCRAVGHVPVMQNKSLVFSVGILVKVIDTVGVEQRAAPFDAVNFVPQTKQMFREVGTILTGDSGDQRSFHGSVSVSL